MFSREAMMGAACLPGCAFCAEVRRRRDGNHVDWRVIVWEFIGFGAAVIVSGMLVLLIARCFYG